MLAMGNSKVDAMRAMREARLKSKTGTVRAKVAEADPGSETWADECAVPVPVSKSQERRHAAGKKKLEPVSSVEVQRAAVEAVKEKHGKKQLLVRIDPSLLKEVKIAAVEDELTVEAWVEAAIRQELKARRA